MPLALSTFCSTKPEELEDELLERYPRRTVEVVTSSSMGCSDDAVILEHILTGYDINKIPGEGAVKVAVETWEQEVSKIIELTSEFELDIYLTEMWTDPMLAFAHLNPCKQNISVDGAEVLAQVWNPKACFVNSKDASVHKSPFSNIFLQLYQNGSVWHNYRIGQDLNFPQESNITKFFGMHSSAWKVFINFGPDKCKYPYIVIASPDSQYKNLHFHYGGLDKLAQNVVKAESFQDGSPSPLPDRHLLICHPEISRTELDPGLQLWNSAKQSGTTFSSYQKIKRVRIKRMSVFNLKSSTNLLSIESTITRDVVRTDRKNPFFAGENKPNLVTMTSILLNYTSAFPEVGYIQGMSDLLSPLLITFDETKQEKRHTGAL
ncbi:neurotransmitter-gated ion-channel ligand binding domain-containing protein [Ditylenchus destructor]|uniref:Neurotransmitter-gated ion-channel ligand binding domain-containing protein n=1 Tax=Ditylenchus destructor TaxID=166010 RepID=A0AAD4QWS0_9BILA|nr:neurotransmitter-gated ion-channel ligand binding domain-containing protein [Ditylenchus destructor]